MSGSSFVPDLRPNAWYFWRELLVGLGDWSPDGKKHGSTFIGPRAGWRKICTDAIQCTSGTVTEIMTYCHNIWEGGTALAAVSYMDVPRPCWDMKGHAVHSELRNGHFIGLERTPKAFCAAPGGDSDGSPCRCAAGLVDRPDRAEFH